MAREASRSESGMSWERKLLIADGLAFLALGLIWWENNVGHINFSQEEESSHMAAGRFAVTVACENWRQTPYLHSQPTWAGEVIPINGHFIRSQTVSMVFACSDSSVWGSAPITVEPRSVEIGEDPVNMIADGVDEFQVTYQTVEGSQATLGHGVTAAEMQDGRKLQLPEITLGNLASSEVTVEKDFTR